MVDQFLEYLAVEKRYSSHTIIGYRKDLEDFVKFNFETEGTGDIALASKKVIRNFMMSLSDSGMAKRSINRKLSSLRGFYLFLLKLKLIETSPMDGIRSLKFYAEKQIPFSEEEMQALRLYMIEQEASFQDRMIVELLYQTGIRRAELCDLKLSDINFSKNEIRVRGKGNKMRIIPLSIKLVADLRNFVKERKGFGEFFFIAKNGGRISEHRVYSIVKLYLRGISVKKKCSPHMLRHSFATHVLDNGGEISKVQKILGHVSLASTQVYTDASIHQLKKVFNAAHPRAKKE